MKKTIKKYGNSIVIVFTREESKIYNLNVGDIIDIELVKVSGSKKNG